MSFIAQLSLQHYRCYDTARLEHIQNGLVVLCGANGAGKTNILEAISLLSPGRGLRSAKAMDMQRYDSPQAWGINAKVQDGAGIENQLATGLNPQKGQRHVRINGVDAKSQVALSDYLSCLWLTPQMDRLFLEGASSRRQFLDRMIFAFDPAHSGRVRRYENAMRQRSKILQEGMADPVWLSSLENQMAETGIAIAAARVDFISRLQEACLKADKDEENYFPAAVLGTKGTIENLLQNMPAIEVEQAFTYQLEQSRSQDAVVGGAATGPHKSDMDVVYKSKNMAAAQCSTGEQKALLIGLVLAHGRMMMAERGAPPVLLLDEIAAHLDAARRNALFERLNSMGGQVWMTGTDPVLFSDIQNQAQFFDVESAQISPKNQFQKAG
jgi:DNA replication and repair protein RecF